MVNTALDEESFAVDIACKQAIRKGARLVYVGPEDNRTSRFAELHLRCLPGGQAFAVLGLLKDFAALGRAPSTTGRSWPGRWPSSPTSAWRSSPGWRAPPRARRPPSWPGPSSR